MRINHLLIVFLLSVFSLNVYADEIKTPQTNDNQENKELIEAQENSIFGRIEKWYEENMEYHTITLLMAIESSFVPLPSEIVIPPAAYVASKEDSHLNIYLVVLFGTIGALIGAYFNYGLAYFLGRPIIHKFADSKLGRWFLLSSEKVEKAENYFNKHGKTSTFIGRLIPVIRQLISLPAGLARMNLVSFSILTFLGAGIWNIILAFLGYFAQGKSDLIYKYSHEIGYIILGGVVIAVGLYFYSVFRKKKK